MDPADVWDLDRREFHRLPAVPYPCAYVIHGIPGSDPGVRTSLAEHLLMRTGVGDNVEVFLLFPRGADPEDHFPAEALLSSESAMVESAVHFN